MYNILIGIVFIITNICINKDAKGQFIRKKNMKNNPCPPRYLYNFFFLLKPLKFLDSEQNNEIIDLE